ncbi:hypothetical protein NBO_229g0001 [Nosema bombycis CQ1]|uniref:Uncharacterized protein n=1 Tax=Nosema bombycis (strain CQ1 / CVCC 102059) TaxID=578461 RepID=R0KS60_NOSB1|nr:hypothetical protein NBO_229g0001 [Nosema bombycis CQ1]|eukprot:EOB13047.1 hypothetical protein NBO_229g0001 [Nosema bombycis CQ1]
MSNTLKKNCTLEIDLETLLYENKLEEIKNHLDVNEIKGNKKIMDFIHKIKEINEVKKDFESVVKKE